MKGKHYRPNFFIRFIKNFTIDAIVWKNNYVPRHQKEDLYMTHLENK